MKIHEIIIPMMLNVMMILILAIAPVPADAADAAMGAKISAKHCTKCHGEAGKGYGDVVKKLKNMRGIEANPSEWTNQSVMSKWTDEQLVQIIKEGGKAVDKSKLMPPWGHRLLEAEIDDLVAYISSLAK